MYGEVIPPDKGNWILTGVLFHLADVAHILSNVCRLQNLAEITHIWPCMYYDIALTCVIMRYQK